MTMNCKAGMREMRERPIIFSDEMVRAILAGNKTQTRRVVKPQPVLGKPWKNWFTVDPVNVDIPRQYCPYGLKGDRLWVREKFSISGNGYFYSDESDGTVKVAWSSPIHMPRKASRIMLEITNVRVERLQEISETDAKAEGVIVTEGHINCERLFSELRPDLEKISAAQQAFSDGWDKLNAKRGFSWDSNPWVWVIEFKKL